MGAFAWVTLATNDSYSLGALVLAHSLRRVGTQHDLAVLITPGVTQPMREKLAAVFSVVQEVNVLDSKDEANLAVLQRPELGITFTKLHCWRFTQYEKCVFVDADALVVRNCDELFEREELSAAPDVGWPDCFNSGVFVFKPSQQTFTSIAAFAASQGSFDGADQGLLNSYFSDWAHKDISKHLPFIYNMCATATYSYVPAFKQYGANVKIVHFIANTKPWLQYFDTMTGIVQTPFGCDYLQPLLQMWWNIFCECVHPQLSDVMGGLAGALSKLTMGEARTDEQRAIEDHMRKQNWEQGQIDFMGRDSFDNIMKKINETLAAAPTRQTTPPKETRQPKKSSSKSSEVEADVEESQAATPVLETEDLSKPSVTQEPPEDVCQRITEKLSLDNVEPTPPPPATPSTEIATSDKTIDNQTPIPDNNIVPATEIADVPKPSEQLASTEPQTIVDVKQTETITSETISDSPISPEAEKQTPAPTSEVTAESLLASTDLTTSIYLEPSLTGQSESDQTSEQTMSQIVSEATTECPVPIQVAESVLQAEPKETVSEEPRPVIEAVASSITPSVQESAASVSEALIQPEGTQPTDQAAQPPQLNGNDPYLQLQAADIPPAAVTSEPEVCSLAAPVPVPQEQPETQSTDQQTPIEPADATKAAEPLSPSDSAEKEDSACEKPKLTVKLPQTETSETQAEVPPGAVTEPSQAVESEQTAPPSADTLPAPDQEPPIRPNRSKDLKIPGTPTVTAPTPPTSPPFVTEASLTTQEESQPQSEVVAAPEKPDTQPEASPTQEIPAEPQAIESQEISGESKTEVQSESQQQPQPESEKKSKKIAKKSSAESDSPPESEGSSKKTVKKVVKKVGKKPKEGTDAPEGGGSEEKPKKKGVRKLSKSSSTSLETEAAALDTPPPSGSSEPPVPPKRKSKSSSSTKVTDKKPDES